MSAPRILFAPTHITGLASAVAAAVAEMVGRRKKQVRFHHLGIPPAIGIWDRWEGSSFLDPSLYSPDVLIDLYERTTRGAHLSLLACSRGLLDAGAGSPSWTPADVARLLDCPVVLLVDARGWGAGLAALVDGFNERSDGWNLAAVLLSGVEDRRQREILESALAQTGLPVVGCLYEGDGPRWISPAPGPWGLPVPEETLEAVFRQVDLRGLETLAGQRGFLPAGPGQVDHEKGPLIMVAGGRGFTPWSRDSVEVLRMAGGRVRRLDLAQDTSLPEETAGLIVAGHLWPAALTDLASNQALIEELRMRISEGLPTVALGGGALYLLRRLQDPAGRTVELAGVLPADGEILGHLDEPSLVQLEAERDTLLLRRGEMVPGWIASDAEIIGSSFARSFPFSLMGEGWPERRMEGAATDNLLCTRVLVHLASIPQGAARIVGACRQYATR